MEVKVLSAPCVLHLNTWGCFCFLFFDSSFYFTDSWGFSLSWEKKESLDIYAVQTGIRKIFIDLFSIKSNKSQ